MGPAWMGPVQMGPVSVYLIFTLAEIPRFSDLLIIGILLSGVSPQVSPYPPTVGRGNHLLRVVRKHTAHLPGRAYTAIDL